MKYTMLIICGIFLLTGCGGNYEPVVTSEPVSVVDNTEWYEEQIAGLEIRLAKKDEQIANLNNQALRLSGELQTTQLALGIQKALHEQQLAQMTALVNAYRADYFVDSSAIDSLQNLYIISQDRLAEINKALATVWNKTVTIETDNSTMPLSDNITTAEYDAFYKGWDLWWWTFNEKPEEEEEDD